MMNDLDNRIKKIIEDRPAHWTTNNSIVPFEENSRSSRATTSTTGDNDVLDNSSGTVEAPVKLIIINENQLETSNLSESEKKISSQYFLLGIFENALEYSSYYYNINTQPVINNNNNNNNHANDEDDEDEDDSTFFNNITTLM